MAKRADAAKLDGERYKVVRRLAPTPPKVDLPRDVAAGVDTGATESPPTSAKSASRPEDIIQKEKQDLLDAAPK